MAQNVVYSQGKATITIPAGEKIAIATEGTATLYQLVGYPNHPSTRSLVTTLSNGVYTSSAYASGATLELNAGAAQVFYEVGTAPAVESTLASQYQGDPTALNATGTLTIAAILSGIVTSTTAAAVTATLDTGAIVDAGSEFAIGDSFDWHVINTGGANAFTVTAAASGHTVVGAGAVAASSSGSFRTRKTAADTFVTYRIG